MLCIWLKMNNNVEYNKINNTLRVQLHTKLTNRIVERNQEPNKATPMANRLFEVLKCGDVVV